MLILFVFFEISFHATNYSIFLEGGGPGAVIAQQTSKYIMGSLLRAFKGETLEDSTQYLADIRTPFSLTDSVSQADFRNMTISDLLLIFRQLCFLNFTRVAMSFQKQRLINKETASEIVPKKK